MEPQRIDTAVDAGAGTGETAGTVNPDAGRDEAALAALSQGDGERALSHVVREHGIALGRYCMAILGSRAEADDVVGSVLLALCSGALPVADGASLRATLMQRVRRDCARRVEGRRGGVLRIATAGERIEDTGGEAHDRAAIARNAIQRLRPTEREALVARFVAQLSYAEIAFAWDVDEAEAHARVSRALASLSTARRGMS